MSAHPSDCGANGVSDITIFGMQHMGYACDVVRYEERPTTDCDEWKQRIAYRDSVNCICDGFGSTVQRRLEFFFFVLWHCVAAKLKATFGYKCISQCECDTTVNQCICIESITN